MNTYTKTAVLVAALAAVILTLNPSFAAEKPDKETPKPFVLPDPIYERPDQAYAGWWLELTGDPLVQGKKDGSETVRVFMGFRNGRATVAWAAHEFGKSGHKFGGRNHMAIDQLAVQLTDNGRKLSGTLDGRATFHHGNVPNTQLDWTFEAGGDGQKLTGTWKARWKSIGGVKWGAQMSVAADREATGTLVAYPAAAESLAKDQSWTHFQGTTGGYSTPAPSGPMIENIEQARPVWRSEEFLGAGYSAGGSTRYIQAAVNAGPCGGASSPVIHSGIVYMYYYVPNPQAPYDLSGGIQLNGTSYKTEEEFRAAMNAIGTTATEQQMLLDYFRTSADDVIVAMDANTGATLWRMRVPGRCINIQAHKMRALNPSPVIVEGPGKGDVTLVTHSYVGTLYAVDAKTGRLRWRDDKGQAAFRGRNAGTGFFEASPVVAESGQGMVVVTTEQKKSGSERLVARDLATGTEKWNCPLTFNKDAKGLLNLNGPLHYWKSPAGPAVIKVSSRDGQALAVDLATGKPLWGPVVAFPGKQFDMDSPFMVGDILLGCVANKVGAPAADGKPAKDSDEDKDEGAGGVSSTFHCVRATATGIQPVWTMPIQAVQNPRITVLDGQLTFTAAGTLYQVDLATGNVLAKPPFDAGPANNAMRCGDRVLALLDGAHGATAYQWFALDPTGKNTKRLNEKPWSGRHGGDGTYHGSLISWPIVDGRWFVRGSSGLYCYDLRTPTK